MKPLKPIFSFFIFILMINIALAADLTGEPSPSAFEVFQVGGSATGEVNAPYEFTYVRSYAETECSSDVSGTIITQWIVDGDIVHAGVADSLLQGMPADYYTHTFTSAGTFIVEVKITCDDVAGYVAGGATAIVISSSCADECSWSSDVCVDGYVCYDNDGDGCKDKVRKTYCDLPDDPTDCEGRGHEICTTSEECLGGNQYAASDTTRCCTGSCSLVTVSGEACMPDYPPYLCSNPLVLDGVISCDINDYVYCEFGCYNDKCNDAPCTADWQILSDWSDCVGNIQTREVVDANNCGDITNKPEHILMCFPGHVCGNGICEFPEETDCPEDCVGTGGGDVPADGVIDTKAECEASPDRGCAPACFSLFGTSVPVGTCSDASITDGRICCSSDITDVIDGGGDVTDVGKTCTAARTETCSDGTVITTLNCVGGEYALSGNKCPDGSTPGTVSGNPSINLSRLNTYTDAQLRNSMCELNEDCQSNICMTGNEISAAIKDLEPTFWDRLGPPFSDSRDTTGLCVYEDVRTDFIGKMVDWVVDRGVPKEWAFVVLLVGFILFMLLIARMFEGKK